MKHLLILSRMSEATEDIRRVLTIVFRGIDSLPPHDLERTLSFDMEWVAPHEAEVVVAELLKAGWLEEVAGEIKLGVELGEVSVPFGWFPRPNRLLKPIPAQQEAPAQADAERKVPQTETRTDMSLAPVDDEHVPSARMWDRMEQHRRQHGWFKAPKWEEIQSVSQAARKQTDPTYHAITGTWTIPKIDTGMPCTPHYLW